MKRKIALLGLALTGVLGLIALRAYFAPRPERFILIIVDSLRADHLGCYGHPGNLTPNIDKLAAQGIRFADCWSAAPWTWPSAAAILTSRYPSEVLAFSDEGCEGYLLSQAHTLPEYMKAAGYITAAFTQSGPFSYTFGFDQGFSTFAYTNTDAEAVQLACSWLSAHSNDRFLAVVWLVEPHFPYEPKDIPAALHQKLSRARPHIRAGKLPGSGKTKRRVHITTQPNDDREYSPEEIRLLHRLYQLEIREMDRRVALLLRAAATCPATAIILTADHGEEWLEHGGLGHLFTLYPELLHVPLIVHVPGYSARVETASVSTLDLTPTILTLAGLPLERDFRGLPLFLETPTSNSRVLISEAGTNGFWVHRHSARSGNSMLIHTLTAPPSEPPAPPGGRWERCTLAGNATKPTSQLRAALLNHRRLTTAHARSGEARPLSGRTKEELRALGYLGN